MKLIFIIFTLLFVASGCSTAPKSKENTAVIASVDELMVSARKAEQAGSQEEALLYYTDILKQDPENTSAMFGSAKIYLKIGEHDPAKKLLLNLLEMQDDNNEVKAELGLLLLRQGNREQSFDLLSVVSKTDYEDWRVWNALGILYDMKGNYQLAQDMYRKATQINSGELLIQNNMAYSLMMAHEFSSAEKVFKKLYETNRHDQKLRNNLAICIARQGRFEQAVNLLNGQGKEPANYNNIGYIAMLMGHYDVAEEYFEKAITSNPRYYPIANQNLLHVQQLRHRENVVEP